MTWGSIKLYICSVYSQIIEYNNSLPTETSEIKELKEVIKERELDLAYEDSFEQSEQIREDIVTLKKELSTKESAYSSIKNSLDEKTEKKESTLGAIAKFKDKISNESKLDEKKNKGVEL